MSNLFTLDESSITYGSTSVDNQFLLEYMPGANGDYVKVYLYGLVHAVCPKDGFCLEQMEKDLSLEEDKIFAAYRYWERLGLVHRISDNPPVWQYLSANQRAMIGNVLPPDSEYQNFCEALYQVFGSTRDLEAKELSLAYEWKLDLGLPTEVILMLVNYMISMRGTNFSFQAAQKVAVSLANENVHTIPDAEKMLGREKRIYDGTKKILRRLGKRRDPSVDEQNLYQKWTEQWKYSHGAIEAACAETTKGEPTFGYLDGILNGMKQRAGKAMTSADQVSQSIAAENDRKAPLRELISVMGLKDLPINEGTLRVYEGFHEYYPDEIILLAGRECGQVRNATLETVGTMLESWKNRGLETAEEVCSYIENIHQLNAKVRQLFSLWEVPYRPGTSARDMLNHWLNELRLSWDTILEKAPEAKGKEHPMQYLNALLDPAKSAGSVPQKHPAGKVVTEQQYTQREYDNDEGRLPAWMAAAMGVESHDPK